MKISIINGSPRKNGATSKILSEIEKLLLQKEDVDVLKYNLSDYEITLCKGCTSCYRTGECVIKSDEIERIVNEIKNSDGIIIGSPTYGSSISSYLKAFFDRGHFIVEQSLNRKYGFSVVTYEIAEGNKALSDIKKFFLVSGASRNGSILLKTGFNSNPLENKENTYKIKKRIEKYYNNIKMKKKRSFWEFIFRDIILIRLIWKPIFTKNIQRYSGTLRLWRQNGVLKS